MFKRLHVLRSPDDEGASAGGGAAGTGGGAAGAGATPGAAAGAGDAGSGAGAGGDGKGGAAAGAGAGGAGDAKGGGAGGDGKAAGAGAAGAGDGKGAAAAKGTDGGFWPDNWRETVSKDDAKKLAQLQRYASPEAALQALFAAQERIRSGELKPALSKNATAEELKEWRAAHGIPEAPDKYDLGKDITISEADKPVFDVIFKAAHESNQTPEQVKATVQAFAQIQQVAAEYQQEQDQRLQVEAEEALRAEWGPEYRRNMNLIHGLLDGTGSQDLKASLLGGRLADGTPIGSSPEALRMLLGISMIQNPTGVVVPGGDANREQGIRGELEKLQQVPAEKKTAQQSERERNLIDAAIQGGWMDASGNWKK